MFNFSKLLHSLERLAWKNKTAQRYAPDPAEELEMKEEEEIEQKRLQQIQKLVPSTIQPSQKPQFVKPDVIDSQSYKKELARRMSQFIMENLYQKRPEEPKQPFPNDWKQGENLQLFMDIFEHPQWYTPEGEHWIANQVAGAADVADIGRETMDPEFLRRLDEAKPFQESFLQLHREWIEKMTGGDDNAIGKWVSEYLGPVAEDKRKKYDNRSNALFKFEMVDGKREPTVLKAALTNHAFRDRLYEALKSKGFEPKDLWNSITMNDYATKHRLDTEVLRGLISNSSPGAADGIQDILLNISQKQNEINPDPIISEANKTLWRFWGGSLSNMNIRQESEGKKGQPIGTTSLEKDIGEGGSLSDVVDTEKALEERVGGGEEDPEEQKVLQDQMTQKIQGLTVEKVRFLRDMADDIEEIAKIHDKWVGEHGTPMQKAKTERSFGGYGIEWDGKGPGQGGTYPISRGEMMKAYMDAVSSQVEDLLKPGNYKQREAMLRQYNKGKDKNEQIAEESPEAAEARRRILESLKGKALWQKGHAAIGVNLVGTQKGGDLGYEFDLGKLVNAAALKKHFANRAMIISVIQKVVSRHAKKNINLTVPQIRKLVHSELDIAVGRNLFGVPLDKPVDVNETKSLELAGKKYIDSKIDKRYVQSALAVNPVEIRTIELAGREENISAKIRQNLQWNWTKTWDYIFDALNTGKYSEEMIRMFTDTIGIHESIRGHLPPSSYKDLQSIQPQWYTLKEKELVERLVNLKIPLLMRDKETKEKREATPVERIKYWQKVLRGKLPSNHVRRIWKDMFHRDIPPDIDEWLKYRDKVIQRTTKDYPFEEQYMSLLHSKDPNRWPALVKNPKTSHYMFGRKLFAHHQSKIASLILLRNTLLKVASIGSSHIVRNPLDMLISGAARIAGEELAIA